MRPNILLLLADQHRAEWGGWNPGLPLRTPHLDRLVDQGVRFTRAVTPSPLCAPARACLASGRAYAAHGVRSNRENFPPDVPTIYRSLRDSGYHTCTVGKLDLHKDGGRPRGELHWELDGSRNLSNWGFTEGCDNEGKLDASASFRAAGRPRGPYMNYLESRGLAELFCHEHEVRKKHCDAYVTALPYDAYLDNWIAENGMARLKAFPAEKPWFLLVNFAGPHNPMDVTARMAAAWEGVCFPNPEGPPCPGYTAKDHQRNRRHYAAMIENLDRLSGRFVDLIRERGESARTIVLYTSDHGEMLGDHGLWGKSVWHPQAIHIPLIIHGPGVTGGRISNALASLHDVGATILDWAGVPGLPGMDAVSLRPVLDGSQEDIRETVTSALGNWSITLRNDGGSELVVPEIMETAL